MGQQLYSEKLARIYQATFQDQLEAFAYLRQHKDKRYSAVDCLSFVVMHDARHVAAGSALEAWLAALPS